MKCSKGHGFTIPLADDHRCDITLHEGKIFNELNYDVWKNGNGVAKYHNSKKFFRWELLFGRDKPISVELTNRKFLKTINELNGKIDELEIDDEITVGHDSLK